MPPKLGKKATSKLYPLSFLYLQGELGKGTGFFFLFFFLVTSFSPCFFGSPAVPYGCAACLVAIVRKLRGKRQLLSVAGWKRLRSKKVLNFQGAGMFARNTGRVSSAEDLQEVGKV
ncbi:unnamed protein product [Caretta caretta]